MVHRSDSKPYPLDEAEVEEEEMRAKLEQMTKRCCDCGGWGG